MRLYNLSNGGKVCVPSGRGLNIGVVRRGKGAVGSNLLLQPNLGASTAGAGLIQEVKQPMVVPIKDTTGLQQKLAGLSKLRLSGKKRYANI